MVIELLKIIGYWIGLGAIVMLALALFLQIALICERVVDSFLEEWQ